MCQFASQLKKRNMLWRTSMASNGRWLLNRIINIKSHQVEDSFFIKLPILGLTHAPWIGWDRDRSCMLWLCLQKTSFFTFIFFSGVCSSHASGQLCNLMGLSRDADCMSVTTKPINLERGRTRKAPQGCAEALEGIPPCESLNFSPDFTESSENKVPLLHKRWFKSSYIQIYTQDRSQTCQHLVKGVHGSRCRDKYKRRNGGAFSFQESETQTAPKLTTPWAVIWC